MALQQGETPERGPCLLDFFGNESKEASDGLPISLDDYIDLVDWSGRVVREDKRGAINEALPPILERLEIDAKTWQKLLRERKGSSLTMPLAGLRPLRKTPRISDEPFSRD